jgi:hypothetical protein
MSAAAVNHTMLQKAFLLMMCTPVAAEAMAARDAVLRLARCGPHELAASLIAPVRESTRSMEMAEQILGWSKIINYLSPRERLFVEQMSASRAPSSGDVAWLEKIYARIFEGEEEEENV